MLWNFRRPIALPTTSPCKWILKGPRFSSFPFHNDKTSPSEVEDTPQSFWHHLKKEDMDMFRMLKAANGAITKEFYAKMQAKPDILRVFLAQRRAAQKQKYQTVTKFRTSRIRIAKDWYQAHKQDESYRRRCNMYLWCFHPTFRRPWIDHLPWPTHRPLAYRQKVAHCCAECGTRHSGLKSWVSTPVLDMIEELLNVVHFSGNPSKTQIVSCATSITLIVAGLNACPKATNMSEHSKD